MKNTTSLKGQPPKGATVLWPPKGATVPEIDGGKIPNGGKDDAATITAAPGKKSDDDPDTDTLMIPPNEEQDLRNPLGTKPESQTQEVSDARDEGTGGPGTPLPPVTRNTWLTENKDKTSTLIVPKTREECISFLNATNQNGTEECHLANENIAANQKFPIICEMFKILFATQTDVMGAVATNTQTSKLNANTAGANAAAMQQMEQEVQNIENAEVPLATQQSTADTVDGKGKTEDSKVPLLEDGSAGGTAPSKPDETQNENGNGKQEIGGDATVTGETDMTGASQDIQNEGVSVSNATQGKSDQNKDCDCDEEIEKYVNKEFGGGDVQYKLKKFKKLTEAGKHPTQYDNLDKIDIVAKESKYHVSFL